MKNNSLLYVGLGLLVMAIVLITTGFILRNREDQRQNQKENKHQKKK